jgi:hypothetical protein
MANEEGTTCSICLESLLSSEVGALCCGHVYHSHCISQWLEHKPACTQCKTANRQSDVRPLHFEVSTLPLEAVEEVRRLEAASLEQCHSILAELDAELADVAAEIGNCDQEIADLNSQAQSCRQVRMETNKKVAQVKEELPELESQAYEANYACSMLQASLDAEAPQSQRTLPVRRPRESDHDLLEERRKLRAGSRLEDRGRQLHESLVSAMQQELGARRMLAQREANCKQVEDELKDLRRVEGQMRQDLDELKDISSTQAASQNSCSTSSSSRAIANPANDLAGGAETRSIDGADRRVAKAVSSDRVTIEMPQMVPSRSLVANEEDDTDILYGGAPKRLKVGARKGALGRSSSSSASLGSHF